MRVYHLCLAPPIGHWWRRFSVFAAGPRVWPQRQGSLSNLCRSLLQLVARRLTQLERIESNLAARRCRVTGLRHDPVSHHPGETNGLDRVHSLLQASLLAIAFEAFAHDSIDLTRPS